MVIGTVLHETCGINLSLLALGKVIKGLAANQAYINFRDSKLTRYLEYGLTHGKVCMIGTISPSVENMSETLATVEKASIMAGYKRFVNIERAVEHVMGPAELVKMLRTQLKRAQGI